MSIRPIDYKFYFCRHAHPTINDLSTRFNLQSLELHFLAATHIYGLGGF